jgi:uncharacterized protein (TIGR00266 family)
MQIEIVHRPANSAVKVTLAQGESLTAEGGAMIAMSDQLQIETTTHKRGKGSVVSALKRMLTGESFFLNHYTAGSGPGEVILATTLAGDMMEYTMKGPDLIVQAGSFVACTPTVEMDMSWQGFGKAVFSGESMFWIRMSGSGSLILSSFGAIYPIQVDGEVIVDTGHIVAFDESLTWEITKAGKSWISSFLGGEGLVAKFSGQGTVWCQSHNADSFGQALGPQLRTRS